MATEKDLMNAVRDSLESDGVLGRLKAEMRTEVMRLLGGPSNKPNRITKIESPPNVILMNELVREYLDWIGYKYTSSVLIAECKLSKQPLDRSFLLRDLGVRDSATTKNLPLLYSLVETTKSANNASEKFS
ncbi:centrosomal protein 20 [Venturia canescens]|uniref:centrosomal protein 20 n=1 Tax=Venturia canescens TaxID=32260 RepID=UPI001C9CB2A3|nr:centrosomal protein 20 [Venturia canescens]